MKFLKSLWRILREYTHRFNEGEQKLDPQSRLGRYLTSSSYFSKNKDRVKYNALMPIENSKTNQFETSIFNIEDLSESDILNLAQKHILPNLHKNGSIHGTGITNLNQINDVGLTAEISEPPKRHLNIVNWPEEKSKRKQTAMELARLCKLLLFEQKLNK